uniref:DnaJ sub C member 3 n=1 Tax=Sphaerodactylus townsendi TaxID=933632 RepID=A0ACB8FJ22_9SAUR
MKFAYGLVKNDMVMSLQSNPSDKEETDARSQLLKSDEMQRLCSQAQSEYRQGNYYAAIGFLDEILDVSVWAADLRELRAECYIQNGEPGKAINDLKAASKLKSDNTEAFYKLSTIYYQLGDHELSLRPKTGHLKIYQMLLNLDQDHKECFSHYKQVKKLNKQILTAEELIQEGRYQDAIDKYETVMKTEPKVSAYTLHAKERICHCLSKNQESIEAIRLCTEVLQLERDNVDALKARAEAYLLEEQYEEDSLDMFSVDTSFPVA